MYKTTLSWLKLLLIHLISSMNNVTVVLHFIFIIPIYAKHIFLYHLYYLRWFIGTCLLNQYFSTSGHFNDAIQDSLVLYSYVKCFTSTAIYIDGFVQDWSNSIANALELLQSCTKPSTWYLHSSLMISTLLQEDDNNDNDDDCQQLPDKEHTMLIIWWLFSQGIFSVIF